MRKIAVLLTVVAFALSISVASARDVNRDSLQQAWQAQMAEQQAAKKKAEEAQMNMTAKVEPAKSDTAKTK